MGKYDRLAVELLARAELEVTLTFDELDTIIGGLPDSARKYREWWTNRASSQPHSSGWLSAGRIATPDLTGETVAFRLAPEEAAERLDTNRAVSKGTKSPSGVWIWDDFRSNLIVDRYDPVFASMRASKIKHLRSENSEDAVTWNVFRSLRQIDPSEWLPSLWRTAFPNAPVPADKDATVYLWLEVIPPPALRKIADEGPTEVDVVIEAPSWVWFLEGKLRRDISTGTTTRPRRDQVLRNIDVGTYYSGVRPFYFSLLITDQERSAVGVEKITAYQDHERIRELLSGHRPDGLANLRGVSLFTWQQVGDTLAEVARSTAREGERTLARRAADWLEERGLWARSL